MVHLYPGVQTSRLPAGPRSITTAGTSTTAFVGIFRKGPVDTAVRITSWGQFVEQFGGLWTESEASFAVEHYFLNGGSVAYIVRTLWVDASGTIDDADVADAPINGSTGSLVGTVKARSEGSWGNNIKVGYVAGDEAGTFDMLVREYDGTRVVYEEVYPNLSPEAASPRFANAVVNGASRLVELGYLGSLASTDLPVMTEMPDPDDPNTMIAVPDIETLMQLDLSESLSGGKDGLLPSSVVGSAGWEGDAATALRGDAATRKGLYALDAIAPDTFNLLCVPATSLMEAADASPVVAEAKRLCKRHYAFLVLGAGKGVGRTAIVDWFTGLGANDREYSAGVYPRVTTSDSASADGTRSQDPCGIMAALIARTDLSRGFFKSPAGTEAGFVGGQLEDSLVDLEQVTLNSSGINCLREFPVIGAVAWGGRTLAGANALAHPYKYIAVMRTALVIESSLRTGLQWAVFEPNDEILWSNIRLTVESFMKTLHRQGAFQGRSARDAYMVKCDADTTTQADIDQGIVNIVVGFAPLKPAEFVFVKLKQITQAAT